MPKMYVIKWTNSLNEKGRLFVEERFIGTISSVLVNAGLIVQEITRID